MTNNVKDILNTIYSKYKPSNDIKSAIAASFSAGMKYREEEIRDGINVVFDTLHKMNKSDNMNNTQQIQITNNDVTPNNDEKPHSKYTIVDIIQAIHYLNDYYEKLPEEKGEYPNWGELDNYFNNSDFCESLMYGDEDGAIKIMDMIWETFYAK